MVQGAGASIPGKYQLLVLLQVTATRQLLPAPRHSQGLELAVSRHLRPGEQKTAAGK